MQRLLASMAIVAVNASGAEQTGSDPKQQNAEFHTIHAPGNYRQLKLVEEVPERNALSGYRRAGKEGLSGDQYRAGRNVLAPVGLLAQDQGDAGHSPVERKTGVEVSSIFGDHAVLQREIPVPVWGRGGPGTKVTVDFAGQRKSVVAGGIRLRSTIFSSARFGAVPGSRTCSMVGAKNRTRCLIGAATPILRQRRDRSIGILL